LQEKEAPAIFKLAADVGRRADIEENFVAA